MTSLMKKMLLTGFEPFNGAVENPSQDVVRALAGAIIAGHEVVGAVLPCVFKESIRALRKEMKRCEPTVVICLGVAGGRRGITPERVAINVDDARIADNAGAQVIDRPIVCGGPVAYWSTLPVKAIVQRLAEAKIPGGVSQSAGTFLCNHVFYGLMHALRGQTAVRGGFIHVPWATGQGTPHLRRTRIIEGVRLAVEVSLTQRGDLRVSGGAER